MTDQQDPAARIAEKVARDVYHRYADLIATEPDQFEIALLTAALDAVTCAGPHIEADALRDAADALGPGEAATTLRHRVAAIEQTAVAECGSAGIH